MIEAGTSVRAPLAWRVDVAQEITGLHTQRPRDLVQGQDIHHRFAMFDTRQVALRYPASAFHGVERNILVESLVPNTRTKALCKLVWSFPCRHCSPT